MIQEAVDRAESFTRRHKTGLAIAGFSFLTLAAGYQGLRPGVQLLDMRGRGWQFKTTSPEIGIGVSVTERSNAKKPIICADDAPLVFTSFTDKIHKVSLSLKGVTWRVDIQQSLANPDSPCQGVPWTT